MMRKLKIRLRSGGNFDNSDLSTLDLRDSVFRKCHMDSVNFSNSNLSGVVFGGSFMRNCNFKNADLTNADLMDCDLSGSDFSGAILSGARLSDARIYRSSIKNANLKGLKTLCCATISLKDDWYIDYKNYPENGGIKSPICRLPYTYEIEQEGPYDCPGLPRSGLDRNNESIPLKRWKEYEAQWERRNKNAETVEDKLRKAEKELEYKEEELKEMRRTRRRIADDLMSF
jgi:hypothetical protein